MIGSALGPFLAVILSAIGFWIKSAIEEKKERKEFLRRIEIGITRSLDDTYKTRQKLQYFISRLRTLITEIRAVTDPHHFFLKSINFPPMRDVYRDIDAPNFKVKSYYLQNKLLWADAGIKEITNTVASLKSDFAELQRKNELNIVLMRQNQEPNMNLQRTNYANSLELFADAIDAFGSRFITQGIEITAQVKIYNDHLRKKHGRWFLWKHEGTKFKYFRNKVEQRAFAMNRDSLDRIDKIIAEEVKVLIENMHKRAEALKQENK